MIRQNNAVRLVITTACLSSIFATTPVFGQGWGPWVPRERADRSEFVRRPSNEPISFEDYVAGRRQIEQDLLDQRVMLEQRRSELIRWDRPAQQAFQAAFGTVNPTVRDQVLGQIDGMLRLNQQMTADNFRESSASNRNRYAYVYPNDNSRIYLDEQYWNAPATGVDSRAGTLTHEMSHFNTVGGTNDYVYGIDDASSLARDYQSGTPAGRTRQPWQNADNVQYYMEGAFSTPTNSDVGSSAQNPPNMPPVESTPRVDSIRSNTVASDQGIGSAPVQGQGSAGLSREQFLASMERSMQQFQAADAANRQNPPENEVPQTERADTDTAAPASESGFATSTNADVVARNGEGDYPYYGQNGGQFQPRVNRVYSSDGTSRVIGRGQNQTDVRSQYRNRPSVAQRFYAYQQQAAAQMAAQRQNRVYSADGSSRPIGSGRQSGATGENLNRQDNGGRVEDRPQAEPSSPDDTYVDRRVQRPAGAAAGQRIVYDENAPRQSSTSPSRSNALSNEAANQELEASNSTRTSTSSGFDPARSQDAPVTRRSESVSPSEQQAVSPARTNTSVAPRQAGSRARTASLNL